MRNLFLKIIVVIVGLLVITTATYAQSNQSQLEKCSGSPKKTSLNYEKFVKDWHNCFGKVVWSDCNDYYEGDWQDGTWHGRGDVVYSCDLTGYKMRASGLFERGKFIEGRAKYKNDPAKEGVFDGLNNFRHAKKIANQASSFYNIVKISFDGLLFSEKQTVQAKLTDLGFYKMAIDGLLGRGTFEAISIFNTKHNSNKLINKKILADDLLQKILNFSVLRKQNCDTDPRLCTIAQLCNKASKQNISGKKVWKTTGEATKYVAEAKRNGVACGVQSVVAQPAPKPRDNKTYEVSSGSGFYVSEAGHIVTNHHVVDGCKSMKIQSTGKVWNTTIIANDPQNDLALIKVDKKPAHVFALSAETPFPLQDIIVAGFPFGDSFSSALKFTQGIISAGMGLGNNYSQIQIDAALQPGNSGGPIMDEYGNIVGVAVAKLSLKKIVDEYGVVPENTNFGVKASVVRNLMEGNRVPLKKPNYEAVRKSKLSRMATDGTVHLTCWMTKAQIKEIIKRKDNRKVLFSQFETE